MSLYAVQTKSGGWRRDVRGDVMLFRKMGVAMVSAARGELVMPVQIKPIYNRPWRTKK